MPRATTSLYRATRSPCPELCISRDSAARLRDSIASFSSATLHPSSPPHSLCSVEPQLFQVLRAHCARVAGILRCRPKSAAAAGRTPGLRRIPARWKRLPPERLETYIPASATRMMSSIENPCIGKLATPKLPVMLCSPSMGSVRQPLPQPFRQHLCLFRTGFRHQHDELVAAVARHHIRLPRLLFQQPSHARQHQVALEMAHRCRSLP